MNDTYTSGPTSEVGPTYHGIMSAKCRNCGYETNDKTTLEMWNDLGQDCLKCDPPAGAFTEWRQADGSVILSSRDSDGGLIVVEVPA